MAPRLQEKYEQVIRTEVGRTTWDSECHGSSSAREDHVEHGRGLAMQDKKNLDIAADAMTEIAGQKPVLTLSRGAIAGFRLREGVPIGCKVTLRRAKMYEFLDRLISIVLPRVRDFRGISRTAFDGNGNYSLGCPSNWSSRN